jgi:nitrogen-specific signal transduction histidine kinase
MINDANGHCYWSSNSTSSCLVAVMSAKSAIYKTFATTAAFAISVKNPIGGSRGTQQLANREE